MAWSQALEKLIESVSHHLGRFSNAYLMLKDAKAKANCMILLADAEKKAEDIRQGRITVVDTGDQFKYELIELNQHSESERLTPQQRVLARMAHQEAVKDNNLQKIIAISANDIFNLAAEYQQIEVGNVDEDIVRRIFDEAQYISNEDLQKIWAGLLTNSILRPEKVSVDLVDFVRKLSNKRAEKITKLYELIFSEDMIVTIEEITKDIFYFLEMQALGLLSGVGAIGLTKSIASPSKDRHENSFVYGDRVLIIINDDADAKFSISGFQLTDLGRQVKEICNAKHDYKYFEQLSIKLKNDNPNFIIKVADIVGIQEELGQRYIHHKNQKEICN